MVIIFSNFKQCLFPLSIILFFNANTTFLLWFSKVFGIKQFCAKEKIMISGVIFRNEKMKNIRKEKMKKKNPRERNAEVRVSIVIRDGIYVDICKMKAKRPTQWDSISLPAQVENKLCLECTQRLFKENRMTSSVESIPSPRELLISNWNPTNN